MARKRKTPSGTFIIIVLVVAAAVLFAGGEAVLMTRSDTGRIHFARTFGLVDQPELTRLVGRELHRAIAAAGIPADSVHERIVENSPIGVRWTIGIGTEPTTLQTNYAITRTLEDAGAEVLSGREERLPQGGT